MPKVVMATYMKVFVGSMGVITLFLAVAQAFVTPDDESPYITVEPRQLALEVGSSGHFQCTGLLNYSSAITWLEVDGTPVQTAHTNASDGATGIVSDQQGRLLINDAAMNDSREFRCSTADGLHAITVELKVFVMPSYYVESVVIIAVNACLLVIFFACMTAAKVHEHKEKKKRKSILSGNTTYP